MGGGLVNLVGTHRDNNIQNTYFTTALPTNTFHILQLSMQMHLQKGTVVRCANALMNSQWFIKKKPQHSWKLVLHESPPQQDCLAAKRHYICRLCNQTFDFAGTTYFTTDQIFFKYWSNQVSFLSRPNFLLNWLFSFSSTSTVITQNPSTALLNSVPYYIMYSNAILLLTKNNSTQPTLW